MYLDNAIAQYLQKHSFSCFAPKVALFDMDGVLYDSMWNHAYSWNESMRHFGYEMSKMDAFRYEGMRGVETIKIITREQQGEPVTDKEAASMYKYKSEVYASKGIAPLISGVKALQEKLHANDYHIGVVTGSGQPTLINRILQDFKGLVSPRIIVTANDVNRGKPAPDPYIMGMQKATTVLRDEGMLSATSSLQPWQTIVIENAPLGVRAAVAAQCFTIAVNTGPLSDEELWQAGADIVCKNMSEVTELLFK